MRAKTLFASARLLLYLSFVVALAAFARASEEIREPVPVMASEAVARQWLSFDLPPATETAAAKVDFDGDPPAGRARADVLVRRSGHWWVVSSALLTSARMVPAPRDERVAVLVRFERSPNIYGWADTERLTDRVIVHLVRNVRIDPAGKDGAAMLFASEPMPLTRDGSILRAVPLLDGLFCVGETCAKASASDAIITLRPKEHTRVLRVDGTRTYEIQARAAGRSPVLPTAVSASIVRSGQWAAMTLPDEVAWSNVVLDIVSEGAIQRVAGASLLSLPASTDVHVSAEKGVVVRPLIGKEKVPHVDSEAHLYVFPEQAVEAKSMIPLATATLANGVFTLPEIGSGSYLLKLLSPESTGEPVTATLTPGLLSDVIFQRGPMIRGRVVRQASGSPDDPIVIEVVRQSPVDGVSEVADWMRNANAGVDGKFQITLSTPGPYRLRARWGTARGELAFDVKDMKKDLDLGEIPLTAGATIRGTLPGCVAGELRMVPIPDFSKPMTVPFFDFRRIPIAPDGAFSAEGLTSGQWTVEARCGEVVTFVTPSIVTVPESGLVFVDLRAETVP